MCLIGKRYREKRSGPPTDPCGTPKVIGVGSDVVSLTLTYCERPVIYDLNHCSASPATPEDLLVGANAQKVVCRLHFNITEADLLLSKLNVFSYLERI